MPEGDTVWQTAHALRAALEGKILTACDVRVPRYATVDLTGTRVDSVVSRGKHLLIRVDDASIHTHLKMEGAWQIYRTGERWRRPAHQARIILATEDAVAVGFSLGITEILDRNQEDSVIGHLGPDLLGPNWNPTQALANLRAVGIQPIGTALLDQRVLAGLGNIYRNEICFLRGLHPRTPTADVPDLDAVVDLSFRIIDANKTRRVRVTTGDTRRGRETWVYGRAGKPCRRCGTRILDDLLGPDQLTERQIFFCPSCQPATRD
ncbi:DNA-formamidopyrimidine glycosylase family protein [Rhodococcus sp. IEGM 1379]|uniref:DNA-formamidopyrimidine glycosylase family protein n=1 Tax=Rhodococcus sp. IEGM 1379 TaxID=3047086 RepID=UPI0024B713D6|nr:DNA-formamidopyrimidine glycosylase family protein [Rhodococcus sp. IEGM 1379]MDI9914787.1 DNA-formamidopyrimidine glycosylase family protein [Rhodococcus sp. IEGM 1379]